MNRIFELSGRLSNFLAVLAGILIFLMPFGTVYDVTMRSLGWVKPPVWMVPLTEFSLLYIMALSAPWLVRRNGHVAIRAVFDRLPLRARRGLELFIYVVTCLVCLAIAVIAAIRAVDSWQSGEVDYRALILPSYLLYAPVALGFLLMAIEFLRFLVTPATYYPADYIGEGSL